MKMIDKFEHFLLNNKVRKEGGQAFSNTIRKYYKKKYNICIGYGSYGGCFNNQNVPPGVVFGNYCSIAQNIRIFRANHPKNYFTLHPLFYNPVMGYVKEDKLERPVLKVGHDVWIGEWTIILPNVKEIGNGAIIGAGSVVTKDINPYTIVAGNPVKIIGKRFSEEIIQRLEKTQWWNWDRIKLIENREVLEKIINEK